MQCVCVCVCACTAASTACVAHAYVSSLSAFISILPASLPIGACVEGAQHVSVWVAGICLSIALAFLSVFLCLSVCQAASQKCLQKERSHLSQLKGSPQRELRSPSISAGICDCQRSDKMPPGQCSVLWQAGILHCTDECCLEALSGTKVALLKLNTSA